MNAVAFALPLHESFPKPRTAVDFADAFGEESRLGSLPGQAGIAQRFADSAAAIGHNRNAVVHGLDQGYAKTFVFAGAQEKGGSGVVSFQLPRGYLPCQMHKLLQTVAANLRLKLLQIARNADVEAAYQMQVCVAPQVAPIISQRPNEMKLTLVGRHAAHEQQVGPVSEPGSERLVKRQAIQHPDTMQRWDRAAHVWICPTGDHVPRVKLGIGKDQLGVGTGQATRLLDAALAGSNIAGVVGAVESRRRHVVVADHTAVPAPPVQVQAGRPADGMVIEQNVVRRVEIAPVRPQRPHFFAQLGVAMPGIGVGRQAAPPEPATHAEHVVRHGISRDEARRQKMNAHTRPVNRKRMRPLNTWLTEH